MMQRVLSQQLVVPDATSHYLTHTRLGFVLLEQEGLKYLQQHQARIDVERSILAGMQTPCLQRVSLLSEQYVMHHPHRTVIFSIQ